MRRFPTEEGIVAAPLLLTPCALEFALDAWLELGRPEMRAAG